MENKKLTDIQILGQLYMEHYNLKDWKFAFDNSKRRFGCCNHTQKIISISKPLTLINDESEIEDTILHEIAHALAGAGNGHNKIWKKIASEIGCKPERCFAENVKRVEGKYKGICVNCNKIYFKHRITQRFIDSNFKEACYYCCKKYNFGKYSEKYLIRFKLNNFFLTSQLT